MDVFDALYARRSNSRLVEPAPDAADLDTMLLAASAAPDHGQLRPWRFILLEPPSYAAFGELSAQAYLERCERAGIEPSEAKITKELNKLSRAPLVIVTACVPISGKIPAIEQFAAVAAATQNLLCAATALGYGTMWRTGPATEDATIKASLGLGVDDSIVGFVYVGTIPEGCDKPPNNPVLHGIVQRWHAS